MALQKYAYYTYYNVYLRPEPYRFENPLSVEEFRLFLRDRGIDPETNLPVDFRANGSQRRQVAATLSIPDAIAAVTDALDEK